MTLRGRVTVEIEWDLGEGTYVDAIANTLVTLPGVTSVRTRDHAVDSGDGWKRTRQGSRLGRERVT